jgi:hypothetical protein
MWISRDSRLPETMVSKPPSYDRAFVQRTGVQHADARAGVVVRQCMHQQYTVTFSHAARIGDKRGDSRSVTLSTPYSPVSNRLLKGARICFRASIPRVQ